jgi:hypothetical protein
MADVRRRLFILAIVASSVAAPAPSLAAARVTSARLTVERGKGAELCPAPQAVREAVVRRLGLDPFTDDGVTDIDVTVSADTAGLHARIAIAGDANRLPAERLLSSARLDCRDLADSIELALSIAINPRLALAPSAPVAAAPPASGPAPLPASSTAPPSARLPTAPPAPASPPVVLANREEAGAAGPRAKVGGQLSLGVDALGTAGLGPGPALGAGVDVRLRRRRWSLELDARAVMPSSADLAGGSVTAWLGMLALVPCGHFHAFAACAVGGVGALRGRGEGFVLTGSATLPTFSVGARVAWERPVGERWWLRTSAELNAMVGRAHLLVDGNEAWVSPRINAILVVSGGSRFP